MRRGIRLVLKPHGGGSGASEEILRCLDKVAHANFKIWYDAGNIIYYTGKDPLAELEPIAKHVTGFCAKDCAAPKAEVMSQFGTGKVDFKAVFAKLKSVGFNGPTMVEGVKVSATAEETTATRASTGSFWRRRCEIHLRSEERRVGTDCRSPLLQDQSIAKEWWEI